MEELLNKLIEKGWKPSGKECSHFIMQHNADVLDWKVIYTAVRKDEGVYNIHYTLRELVSKESGLWQFCVKNKLITDGYNNWTLNATTYCEDYDVNYDVGYWDTNYEYRIIESALKDESELEKFLLENIKIS